MDACGQASLETSELPNFLSCTRFYHRRLAWYFRRDESEWQKTRVSTDSLFLHILVLQ